MQISTQISFLFSSNFIFVILILLVPTCFLLCEHDTSFCECVNVHLVFLCMGVNVPLPILWWVTPLLHWRLLGHVATSEFNVVMTVELLPEQLKSCLGHQTDFWLIPSLLNYHYNCFSHNNGWSASILNNKFPSTLNRWLPVPLSSIAWGRDFLLIDDDVVVATRLKMCPLEHR